MWAFFFFFLPLWAGATPAVLSSPQQQMPRMAEDVDLGQEGGVGESCYNWTELWSHRDKEMVGYESIKANTPN